MCRRRSEPGASERVDGAEGASAAKLPEGLAWKILGSRMRIDGCLN